jgi:hypothetical protein
MAAGTLRSEDVDVQTRDIAGAGSWQADGKAVLATRRWQLDLKRGPGTALQGTIAVAESPLVGFGKVSGRVDGKRVTGVISDARGKFVAQFEGEVSGDMMSGTYTDRTGGTGDWSWDGTVPAALTEEGVAPLDASP